MEFLETLEKIWEKSQNNVNKGKRFENLMIGFLKTDPRYSERFKEVWLWSEFPYKRELDQHGKDTGIDIVALTNNGEYWAIQCKCFQADTQISKPDVDSFITTSGRSFVDEDGKTQRFAHRLWISTTNNWTNEAEEAIKNQEPSVSRLNLSDLKKAKVDWKALCNGFFGKKARKSKKEPREYQQEAINKVHKYFKAHDRGKLIMACGTGKTYTSLKIAENETDGHGLVLFLVPSIALLSQVLNEWYNEASYPIEAICVCSDPGVSKNNKKKILEDEWDSSPNDLALPASTNSQQVFEQIKTNLGNESTLTVIFSTYQSIDVIIEAQIKLIEKYGDACKFDLVICDEAHRTTGVILKDGEDQSAFTKIHDDGYIKTQRRLYMTATPKIYSEKTKGNARKNSDESTLVCSMDDGNIYGEEIYRLGFGKAVSMGLLSDYKVLVLTITDDQIPMSLRKHIDSNSDEGIMDTDGASKLIGCISALSKRIITKYPTPENKDKSLNGEDIELLSDTDQIPMHTAVAFCHEIKDSKKISKIFNKYSREYLDSIVERERERMVDIQSEHVDGSMRATERNGKIEWLRDDSDVDNKTCKILTNVRCLSEGVDVPALDAIMFLSAKKSQIDIVQSVGRVMRKAAGKKYGYVIIPVIVPPDFSPEEVLNQNGPYKITWDVLNALRAHDDRFYATIDRQRVIVGSLLTTYTDLSEDAETSEDIGSFEIGKPEKGTEGSGRLSEISSEKIIQKLNKFRELQNAIYARMVNKVGEKKYLEQWAQEVSGIAKRQFSRIKGIVQKGKYREEFGKFMKGLRTSINPNISEDDAIDMLTQHIITRPVFKALFADYPFIDKNPVSAAMQEILTILDANAIDKDNESLERFYEDVKYRCSEISKKEDRQELIKDLYNNFFKTALDKTADKLGIVYTPVEIVDFIINSVADVLKKELERDISDKNVHILDPFTGTGTFITRLIQSDLIKKNDLERKYTKELHANEIVLLAYYIASINIEKEYHDKIGEGKKYQSFEGVCLTDTFQLGENEETEGKSGQQFWKFFAKKPLQENIKCITDQKKAPITIIMGNPPYRAGQESANDNAQNEKYEKLENRIAETYVSKSSTGNKNSLYDSYIKAFRWASDRLTETGGIIGFITNGGWIDGKSMDGFRQCLEEEFSSIYVFNLKGNIRNFSDKREGGNVFDIQTGVAITLLVKKPNDKKGKATIYYRDIGDYLSQKEKLDTIKDIGSVLNPDFGATILKPNRYNDWINHRNDLFDSKVFIPFEGKKNGKWYHSV